MKKYQNKIVEFQNLMYFLIIKQYEQSKSSYQTNTTRSNLLSRLLEASRNGPLSKAKLCGRLGDLGIIDDKYDVAISTAYNIYILLVVLH